MPSLSVSIFVETVCKESELKEVEAAGWRFHLRIGVILPDACLSFLNRKAPTHHFLRI